MTLLSYRFHLRIITFTGNFPPKIITASNVINATLHETIELYITAVDNDTITFRVINKPAGAIVNQSGNVLHFSWPVASSQKVSSLNKTQHQALSNIVAAMLDLGTRSDKLVQNISCICDKSVDTSRI